MSKCLLLRGLLGSPTTGHISNSLLLVTGGEEGQKVKFFQAETWHPAYKALFTLFYFNK